MILLSLPVLALSAELDKRFDIGLFENMEGTRELFDAEVELVAKLKEVRQLMVEQKELLEKQYKALDIEKQASKAS